jgi:D-alanine-D-alanine ligase
MGGTSAEREISLQTGNAVLAALQRKDVDADGLDFDRQALSSLNRGDFDRVFIALHGRGGEDGQIQGALDSMGVPYTGSGVLGSALAMDKWRTKMVWQACGISTPRYALLTAASDFDAIERELELPLIVKPAVEGSSIGFSKVEQAGGIRAAYTHAARYSDSVIAEAFISGMELSASILGTEALPLIRIVPAGGLYDYEAKYNRDDTQYFCPCGLPEDQEYALQREALRAFTVLGCHGWGRVDILLGPDGKTPYFLEANTVPGMTSHSLVPMAAKVRGIGFDELVIEILKTSLRSVSGATP